MAEHAFEEKADGMRVQIPGYEADAQALFYLAGVRRMPDPQHLRRLTLAERPRFIELLAQAHIGPRVQQQQQIAVRLREAGIKRDSLPVAGRRLIEQALIAQHVAEVVVQWRAPRFQRE